MKVANVQARSIFSLCALTLLLSGAMLYAGPLNPPAGPVASTAKTLNEVEPRTAINAINTPGDATSVYRINQPGSYYLTGNLTGVAGKHGIFVSASNVVIDLNGFSLQSPSASGATLDGIANLAIGVLNVTVKNGTLDGWKQNGINLASNTRNVRLQSIQVRNATAIGILTDAGAVIEDCSVYNCSDGIVTGSACTVTGCYVAETTVLGYSMGEGSTLSNSTSAFNFTGVFCQNGSTATSVTASDCINYGFLTAGTVLKNCTAIRNNVGIHAGNGSVVVDCSASDNILSGIGAERDCSITNCFSTGNGGAGISAEGVCAIFECSTSRNGNGGIIAPSGSTVSNSSASNNTGIGIDVGNGVMVSNCVIFRNTQYGIRAITGCTIADCTTRENTFDGILVTTACIVRGNTCSDNGDAGFGSGVRTTGTENRIESNNCTGNVFGIKIEGTVNMVFGNSCRGNTNNYSAVAGNRIGLIVVPPVSGAVSGNAGAAGFGSNDPWANIAY